MGAIVSFGAELPWASAQQALSEAAARWGRSPAVYAPRGKSQSGRQQYEHHTFHSLDEAASIIARGLRALGLEPGSKAALMVPPSLELYELTFALFRAGIVPVMIDPGLGVRRLHTCFAEARPQAFIGIPLAQVARLAFGWARSSVETVVTVGRRGPWGGVTLDDVRRLGLRAGSAPLGAPEAEALAGVMFTSGSTGVPKGVEYSHRHFVAQVELMRRTFDIRPGDIDLPTFPLFGLFNPVLGVTTVLPDMDATNPGAVRPEAIFEPAEHFGITRMFGSPALLDTVSRAAARRGFTFSSLRTVLSAGAPMTPTVIERAQAMLPQGEIFTPYGATEALPVTSVGSRFLLAEGIGRTREGAGICVGTPVAHQDVRIIRIDDGPIGQWSPELELGPGEIGEITVRGPTVSPRYHGREEATRASKIDHGDGAPVRHRMGDLGYLDEHGRLWFCGRKSQRVRSDAAVHHTVPIEEVFNAHPDVRRTALVGVTVGKRTIPVLCVEREAARKHRPFAEVRGELEKLAARRELTQPVTVFLEHPRFPVDIRHNAKIFRERLGPWAQRRVAT